MTDSTERHQAKRISIFNHKGGVGKTTLTINIAAALASLGKRVLIVDSDPQCNSTAYLVAADVLDELLENSDGDKGRTLWSAIRPVAEGIGDLEMIEPIESGIPGVFLVPGDIQLSSFELDLDQFWSECLQRRLKGFRGTSAISRLVDHLCHKEKFDFVFYDSGPNIGPLNRAVILDCDFFIVPAACDEFSIRALKTLGRTLAGWITDWRTIVELAPEKAYLLPGSPRFLGYIPQRFRIYGGEPTSEFAVFLPKLERQISADIVKVLQRIDPALVMDKATSLRLGMVPDFSGGASTAQRLGSPIHVVGNIAQSQAAEKAFIPIARNIVRRVTAHAANH
jgi:cellulose biosynthesis protein BcsQ